MTIIDKFFNRNLSSNVIKKMDKIIDFFHTKEDTISSTEYNSQLTHFLLLPVSKFLKDTLNRTLYPELLLRTHSVKITIFYPSEVKYLLNPFICWKVFSSPLSSNLIKA